MRPLLSSGDVEPEVIEEIKAINAKRTLYKALFFSGDVSLLDELIELEIKMLNFFEDFRKSKDITHGQSVYTTIDFDKKKYFIYED